MRFTDVTSAAGLSGHRLRDRGGGRRLRQRRPRRSVRGRRAHQSALSQSRRRAIRGRHEGRGHRQRRLRRRRRAGSTTTTTAASISWSSITCNGRRTANPSCGDEARRINIYCHPRVFQGLPNRLYRNRGDRTFEDVSARAGLQAHIGKGMSVVVRRLRPRRPPRCLRHQRRGAELPVPQQRRRHVHGKRARRRRVGAGHRPPDVQHGRRCAGLRQRRLGGHPLHGADRGDVSALPQRVGPQSRDIRRGDAAVGSRRRRPCKSSGWCSIVADVDNDGWKDIFTANSHVNDRIGDFEALEFRAAEQPLRQRRPRAVPRRDRGGRAGGHDSRAPRLRHRRLQRRRPSRHRRRVARFAGRAVAERQRAGIAMADRAADRHEEQPRRHRRAGHRRRSGPDDDHGDGLRIVFTCGAAFRVGAAPGPVRVEVQWPSGVKQVVEGVNANQTLDVTEK